MSTEKNPQPWNEDSESGIKRLIEERDRARELAGKKTAEAEDNLVRAVLAERENAKLRAEVERLKAAPVVVPELTLDDVRGFIREWLSQPLEERGPALPGCPQAELALRKGYTLAASRLRTIGPGEVVVSEKELNVLLILERYARKHGPESIDYAIEALDTIRSQKEGGAT